MKRVLAAVGRFFATIGNFFRSRASRTQVFLAMFLGSVVGFCPTFATLQTGLIVLALAVFYIPWRLFAISIGVAFGLGMVALDPVFHTIGQTVLEMDALQGLLVVLNQLPIVPLTRFNNSVVLGSVLGAMTLAPLLWVLVVWKPHWLIRPIEKS